MIELELLGVGGDGQSLVFTDDNGERYSVQITDELRGVTRRDRPKIEAAPDPAPQSLRPREIQALLRAGATAEDIAARHGMEVQAIRRFEAPVQAEKDYALRRALATAIGNDPDGPDMGGLVVDRLAARGVDPSSLEWTAQREAAGPWQICLTFIQGAAEHGAHWLLTPGGAIEAVDQEAQWLTETVSQTPVASIFTPLPAPERDEADLEEVRAREAILDQLNAARGKRQEIEYDIDDEEDDESPIGDVADAADEESRPDSISARIYSIAQARTKEAAARDESAPPAMASPVPEAPAAHEGDRRRDPGAFWLPSGRIAKPIDDDPASAAAQEPAAPGATPDETDEAERADALPGLDGIEAAPAKKKGKKGRRSVPSWDEIVFGSKSKQ